MCLETSLPFVRTVYDLVDRGKLDECEAWLVGFIKTRPTTRLHCVLDCSFDPFLPAYSDWLMSGCDNKVRQFDSSIAICTSMGEFEINYHDWTADAYAYGNYNEPVNKYNWLCQSKRQSICDWFHFTGLDELSHAFALADEYSPADPESKPPYESDIYTAVCYLFFTYFLQLNRQTHKLAKETGHGLARVHLFSDYGDCLFHSPPQVGPA
jgi:hypothetical protein